MVGPLPFNLLPQHEAASVCVEAYRLMSL